MLSLISQDQSRLWYSPYHSPPEFSPDPCIDHAIGRGHVAEHKGAYHDAIHVKGNHVLAS